MNNTTLPPSEIAMQQAWRFRLWGTGRMKTVQGQMIRVLDPGRLNRDAGPDFKDAKVVVEDRVWVGSIEIHRRASDWTRHGHSQDKAYDNIVLHVVGEDDCRIRRADGAELPQVVMAVGDGFAGLFNNLLHGERLVLPMCGDRLGDVAEVFKLDWLTALAFERLNRKADDVLQRLERENGNWLQAVFVTLARGLGFGRNSDNMERLARSIPYKILLRHTDDVETVEALLFGQAGLLNKDCPADDYESELVREYGFYGVKYGLKPIENPIWQLSARNPANSPYRRIAVLARIVCEYGADIAYRLCETLSADDIKRFLSVEISEYWMNHYSFGKKSQKRLASLGTQSKDLLIINVLAPLVYCRGLETGRQELMDGAVRMLEMTAGEKNSITKGFEDFGLKVVDSFTSQALIQLHREYCERRRCPDCRIGHRILSDYITFQK